jgi:hypothetical protein
MGVTTVNLGLPDPAVAPPPGPAQEKPAATVTVRPTRLTMDPDAPLPPAPFDPMMRVVAPADLDKIPPGGQFRDETGKVRIKPYDVTDDDSYQQVPVGGQYFEGGKLSRKPQAGPLTVKAQTLYDAAITPEGRRKALEYVYGPDAVKEDRGEYYVQLPTGERLSPKATKEGMWRRVIAAAGADVLPTLGAVGGAVAGAAVGGIPGGIVGTGAGGAAGDVANQAILGKLGIEQTAGTTEGARHAAVTGATSMLGQGVGAALPAVKPTLNVLGKMATQAPPRMFAWAGGVQPEAVAAAQEITAEGGKVPISSWVPESPFLRTLTRIAKGFGYDPVSDAAGPWYGRQASRILDALGVPEAQRDVLRQTAAPSLVPAGEAAVNKATDIINTQTQRLENRVAGERAYREAVAKGAATAEQRDIATRQASLIQEAADADRQVKAALDEGWAAINKEADSLKGDPGDAMRAWAARLQELNRNFKRAASAMYSAADEAAGDTLPATDHLAPWATAMLDGLLPASRAHYPQEVALLGAMAHGDAQPITSTIVDQFGQPITKEATDEAPKVTFGALHELRNWLRYQVDWNDLAAGPKQGVFKVLEKQINQTLHDKEADPALKEAAALLDKADAFYRENIRQYEDSAVKGIIKSGTAAAPDNASALAKIIFDRDNLERVDMFKGMMTPELWHNVVAADLGRMVRAAALPTGETDAKAFAREVMERRLSGVLDKAYPPHVADIVQRQADRLMRLAGNVSVKGSPDDTIISLLDKADRAVASAETMAARDPVATLKTEMAKIQEDAKKALADGHADIAADPLKTLLTMPAEAAAEKILSNPDLLRSSAAQFGPEEMSLLRQIWARKYLQQIADRITPPPGARGGQIASYERTWREMSGDVQEILFPGVSKDQMTKLMRQLLLVFPEREGDNTALAMSGMAMMFHPEHAAFLPQPVQHGLAHVPHVVGRFTVGLALNIATKIASSPRLLAWVAKGLAGNKAERDAAMAALRTVVNGESVRSGAMGAAMGADTAESLQAPDESPPPPPGPPMASWRERLTSPGMGVPQGSWRQRATAP